MQLAQGYSLKISKAVESDTGTYTCRICNANAAANRNRKSSATASWWYQDSYDHAPDANTLNSNAERNECDERSAYLKILGLKIIFKFKSILYRF